LAFVDPAEKFDAGDHDCRRREPFETEHRTDAKFHTTVVPLYQIKNLFVDNPSQSVRLRLQPSVELRAAPRTATIQPHRRQS